MRIISEWTYKQLRVSILEMNGRFIIKVEDKVFEQTYKLRDGQVKDLNALKSILGEAFYEKCISLFSEMQNNLAKTLAVDDSEDFEFDDII